MKIKKMIGAKNREIMEFGGFGPSNNKIEKLLHQNEAEESPGAFKPIIIYFSIKIPQT